MGYRKSRNLRDSVWTSQFHLIVILPEGSCSRLWDNPSGGILIYGNGASRVLHFGELRPYFAQYLKGRAC